MAPTTKTSSKGTKPKVPEKVKDYVKNALSKTLEMRYFDYRVTAEQIINNQLSNSSASYYSDPCNVPFFDGTVATSMEGRTGNQIDIRRVRWTGKFKLVASGEPQLRLRFIAVRFLTSSGNAPVVGKVMLNSTTLTTNYNEPIAPDTPYQILLDKKVIFTPPVNTGTYFKDVTLNLRSPAGQKRLVTYSNTLVTPVDYTIVMKGLIRIYWFEDNGPSTTAISSIVSSQMRTYFKDL